MIITPIERFKSKVEFDPETGCVIWTAYCDPKGYAQFGRKGRAARWLYEYVNGPIPEELEISHACHNPACVRPHPEHVIVESHADNMRRSAERGAFDGVNNGRAKLTEQEVLKIRQLWQRESYSARTLAEEFSHVSLRTIYNCVNYETYFNLIPELYTL
jgi:hypothetical protein